MKIRTDINANYKAVFFDGKTVRMPIDFSAPITTPKYAEIEDVAINSKCYANCSYCYTSATKEGINFDNIISKALSVWGERPKNDRPFQIAIGGAGESTIHPDWVEFVKCVHDLGITPNYTTNGMHLSDSILKATNDYCGGVAVSFHPHIVKTFYNAIDKLKNLDVKLNAHIIVGEPLSLTLLKSVYDNLSDVLDYFVILPYKAVGRASEVENVEAVWKETFEWINTVNKNKFAFGAYFYDYIKQTEIPFNMSIYEPEIYSGYRIMDDSFKTLRKSSYDLREK